MPNALIQFIAGFIALASVAVGGWTLPSLLDMSEKHSLRYTDVVVDGAPPIVALGTAMGALRGLIVDYLWIKVQLNRERGLFYEIMADSELITKLQPRFASVWAFHGHNMAYNISVATHTEEERWEWVNRGINLVRNQGLRYNPNDLVLHRELAFWFSHKIEGVADDAHLYYKREFAREWHYLLGEPPQDYQDRIEWIKRVADAPGSLEEARRRTPAIRDLIAKLRENHEAFDPDRPFTLDRRLLTQYAEWKAIRGQSLYAQYMGREDELRRQSPYFTRFDEIAEDPEYQEAWEALLAHLRKRVLLDEYNMDPRLMYEFTRDLGPIDWRSGFAHSLYWARRGSMFGELRLASEDNIYRILNNDRSQIHAMQGLSRFGRISFDPFSVDYPARFPEPRWIRSIHDFFFDLYDKHYDTRGAGADSFTTFHINFMGDKIRELYRMGEHDWAEEILEEMDQIYRVHARVPTPRFNKPIDVFVMEEVRGEYEYQPHIPVSEVYSALRRGYIQAYLYNRERVLNDAITFARTVTEFYRTHEQYDFDTHFGTGRMRDILPELDRIRVMVFADLMIDRSIPLIDRIRIWQNAPNELKGWTYDMVFGHLRENIARDPLGERFAATELIPQPPNLEMYRRRLAEIRRDERDPADDRAPIQRR